MGKGLKAISLGFLALMALLYAELFISRAVTDTDAAIPAPEMHIQIIVDSSDSYFCSQFELGAMAAAQEYTVFVELEALAKWENNALWDSAAIAINSGVDAIAVQSNDSALVLEMQQLATQRGVQLLLYESENYHNDSVASIGSNSYSIGRDAAMLAIETTEGVCQAVLVVEKTNEEAPSTYQNMKVQGALEVFSQYPRANIVETLVVGDANLDGDSLAKALGSLQNSYDTVICLQERTTPIIAQRLIDSGFVGSTNLIGYGMLPQTLEYINRGVVYGTIAPDAYQIGYNTVSYLVAEHRQAQADEYLTTMLHSITQENVQDFEAAWQEGYT